MEGLFLKKKTYVSRFSDCCIYGGRRVGVIRFVNGRYTTDDPKRQSVVENSQWFKRSDIVLEEKEELKKIAENLNNEQKSGNEDLANNKEPDGNDGDDDPADNGDGDNEDTENNDGLFTCEVCGDAFGSKAALNGHMSGHKRKGEV